MKCVVWEVTRVLVVPEEILQYKVCEKTINFTAQNTAKPYSAETFDRCRNIGLRKHRLDFKKRCKILPANCKLLIQEN
jgi:hypothetical protein